MRKIEVVFSLLSQVSSLSVRVGDEFRVGEGVRIGNKDDPEGLLLKFHSDFIDARLGEFLQVCHQFIRAGSHDGAQYIGVEGDATRVLDDMSPLDCSNVVGYRQGSPHLDLFCFSVLYGWE